VTAPTEVTLPITDVFTSLQGEGPAAGRPATFIRLGGCNLSCEWCDAPYTWDASRYDLREQIVRRPVDSILEVVDAPMAVITGGEPLLHQNSAGWRHLLAGLLKAGKKIHVETNGTIEPTPRTRAALDLAAVSPKQEHANAGARTGLDPYQPKALEQFAGMAREGKAVLKVVVRTERNCAEAIVEADLFGWPRSAVWLMPEGTTVEDLQARWRGVCDFAIAHGVNATHRLHVLAWGEERGH
jgi:7-carboxy-7-deazaguanine synthase